MTTKAQSRTRRDHTLWDGRVNDKWGGVRPVLSAEESLAAARKLYRHAMGKAWPGKWELVSGNRHTYPRRGVFCVNPDRRWGERGIRAIVHSISHYCHRRLHPYDKPHSIRQLRLEAKLTKFAVARWGPGAPPNAETAIVARPEPVAKPKPDIIRQRYLRMVSRVAKWERERDRATRLFAKALLEARVYERRHKERLGI